MNKVVLEEIKNDVLPILKKADVTKAALFGSYVRGDNTPSSDIDMLIDLPRGKSLFDLAGLQINLEKKLQKRVDVVTYRSICPHLKDSILSNLYPII
jgi:predicted nucleotidyltransferase